jgi:hypothetical protein
MTTIKRQVSFNSQTKHTEKVSQLVDAHVSFTHFAIDEEGSTVQHLNTGFEMDATWRIREEICVSGSTVFHQFAKLPFQTF